MFSFLQSKHVQQGRQFVKDARKIIAYKKDLWTPEVLAEFETKVADLEKATKGGQAGPIEGAAHALDALCARHLPKVSDPGTRENVEVFLVAIVVALAVRSFFIQPFTIPTGSMFPTLNGIIGYRTEQEPPNALKQFADSALLGRTWVNTVAKSDEQIEQISEVSRFLLFTYTKVITDKNTYLIHIPVRTYQETFLSTTGDRFKAGDPIARGYVDTGDHVFVDKLSYHFRTPDRDQVFVFNTQKLPTNDNRQHMNGPSQFYIKRLVGLPNDNLRIETPKLFVNGEVAKGPGSQRVMSMENDYHGYAYGFPSFLMHIMQAADDPYTVPDHHYFAMGDNSYHSSDSRDWGPVPQENIMGRGVFVYWPFGKHWGLIH